MGNIGWLNVYWRGDKWHAGGLYEDKAEADRIAKPHRIAAVEVILPEKPHADRVGDQYFVEDADGQRVNPVYRGKKRSVRQPKSRGRDGVVEA